MNPVHSTVHVGDCMFHILYPILVSSLVLQDKLCCCGAKRNVLTEAGDASFTRSQRT